MGMSGPVDAARYRRAGRPGREPSQRGSRLEGRCRKARFDRKPGHAHPKIADAPPVVSLTNLLGLYVDNVSNAIYMCNICITKPSGCEKFYG
jgi:hypothetical protein